MDLRRVSKILVGGALLCPMPALAEVWSCRAECADGELVWGWGSSAGDAESTLSCEAHGGELGKAECEVPEAVCEDELESLLDMWWCVSLCWDGHVGVGFGGDPGTAWQDLSCAGHGGMLTNIVCGSF